MRALRLYVLASMLRCMSPPTPLRKPESEERLYNSAVRALMRRAYSVHQMRAYLARRASDANLISAVVARMRENKYLDDAHYALEFARLHANSRRQGRFRIARELRARGVPDQHIETAIDAIFADTDEAALVRARLKRDLFQVRGALGPRKIAALYRSLLRAGFSSEIIRAELRGITRSDLPDLPDAPYGPEGEF
jgi:regulatory protein